MCQCTFGIDKLQSQNDLKEVLRRSISMLTSFDSSRIIAPTLANPDQAGNNVIKTKDVQVLISKETIKDTTNLFEVLYGFHFIT